jgi:hypothetical protein
MVQRAAATRRLPSKEERWQAMANFSHPKALEIAWDMWEQRNHVKHNALHPRAAAAVVDVKVQLQFLHRKGHAGFLSQDRLLFFKSETKLLKGEQAKQMLRWITSVLNATRQAAQAKNDTCASVQVERAIMQ